MKYFSFSLKQLKIIQTIKNDGNIKVAGKNLYLSQPALSSQIKNLEFDIYSKLLTRKKTQIYFTPEGELVLDYANKILKLCEEADNAIIYFKKLRRVCLKIGSTKMIGANISLKIINLFCKRYTYAYVQLQTGCTKSLSWDIINGQIDIGIVQEDQVPKTLQQALYVTPYFEEKVVLILPSSYKQKDVNKISKKHFYKLNFITIKPSFHEREFLDNTLKNYNISLKKLKIKLQLNSIGAVKSAVGAGLGVSFLPNMLVTEELNSKRFYSILINSIKTHQQFILISNIKNTESYLSEQFYNFCFTLLKLQTYNKFLNLG